MLHLIDASPYIFRSFFALPDSIRDRDGNVIHAAYGFASFLVKYIAEQKPSHIVCAFDKSLNSSFRNELYPAYKAQRELPPKELELQLELCADFAEALGMRVLIDDRYEADDLIATVLAQLRVPAVVVTIDKDMAQLVSDEVQMFDIGKEKRYAVADVVEKFGVRPAQIPDFLGLCGDAVDNIPGVKRIGPKTAVELLRHFDTLEELFARVDEIASLPMRGAKSVETKLKEQRDIALLSKQLATVAVDAPVRTTLEELTYRGPDPEKLTVLCDRLGVDTLRERALRELGR